MAYIRTEHVWKRFTLHKDRADSVGRLLVRMIPGRDRPSPEQFWALRDISLSMQAGESLGIIGSNGSGKSTLLKLLTRTMHPSQGTVSLSGRTAALIELGAGFHPDFTGRENVIISASIMGISRREILKRMEEIIDFAGIASFMDVPVKYYSSGMQARLGFAVAINVQPEILIVDEVLAVGDEAFQQKCMDRIFEMKRQGISILLVTHDLSAVDRLMSKAIWINQGVMSAYGTPRDVIQAYRSNLLGDSTETPMNDRFVASGGPLTLASAKIRSGGRDDVIASGESAELTFCFENHQSEPIQGYLDVSIRRPDGLEVTQISGMKDGYVASFSGGSTCITLTIAQVHLVSGRYDIDLTLLGEQGERVASWQSVLSVHLVALRHENGIVTLPHQWRRSQ